MNILHNRLFHIALGAILLIVLIVSYCVNFLMDLWWFDTLGYVYYYGLRETYRDIIAIGITVIIVFLVYANFLFIPRLISNDRLDIGSDDQVTKAGWVDKLFITYPIKVLLPLSILITIPVIFPIYENWELFLLYIFSSSSGVVDPAYGKDISYYLFSYPVYTLVQDKLLIVFSMLFCIISFIYWRIYKEYKGKNSSFPLPAKLHLTGLIVAIVAIEAWSIVLERIEMLYEDRNEPVYFGPGLVDMTYQLPLIWLTFVVFLGIAGSAIYLIYRKKGKRLFIGLLLSYFLLLGFREFDFIPNLMDRFYIKPNPVVAEKKYIQFNIDATLNAFDLSDVDVIDYPARSSLTRDVSTGIYEELYNIPLWDHDLLKNVYQQLQAIRPFYNFSPVAIDRYNLDSKEYQVNIAARELTIEKLPAEAQNWENIHMRYTHGYGAVVTPAAQSANQPMQWFLNELTLQNKFPDISVAHPEIYFGLGEYPYAIVPNTVPASDTDAWDLSADYKGSDGLKISSLILKLVFSAYLKDEKIFFSTSINDKSKILIRRNIKERVNFIAPFLTLDSEPYPVILDDKIYWIMDAYTTSDRYPIVKAIDNPLTKHVSDKVNYIRNSVKIIVDAYNGTVNFYIVDPKDPIVSAYQSAYPGLFKNLSTIPQEFIKHLSYPQDLFTLQMEIFSRYHQTDPDIFYQQSNALEMAKMDGKRVAPYYLTLDILDKPDTPESELAKFILVSPLSPIRLDNLYSIAIAGCLRIENCNTQYAADIFFYKFSQKLQVDGPGQIEALINQNPEISQYFSLWDQRGSKVIKGRIIIIPVERSILYIQPIYLVASTNVGFPQLAKVIVSMNQLTAMGDTIELAYKKLEQQQLLEP